MKLLKENNEEAGLFDICKWFIESYPQDIFVRLPEDIVKIRALMENILKLRK